MFFFVRLQTRAAELEPRQHMELVPSKVSLKVGPRLKNATKKVFSKLIITRKVKSKIYHPCYDYEPLMFK